MFRKAVSSLLFFLIVPNNLSDLWALPSYPEYEYVAATGSAQDEHDIHRLVNRERRKSRLAELEWDERLADLARSYSRKMARERFLDHHDREGYTVIDRANRAKIKDWERIGENLFFCEPIDRLPYFALQGWMRSTTHRQNILDVDWSFTGIGIATAEDGSVYITQIFIER